MSATLDHTNQGPPKRAAPTTVGGEVTAALRRPAFLVVAGVLLVAALGLNASVQAMGMYFKKQRVELRQPLDALPKRLGPWVQVNKDRPLPAEQEHALATDKYLDRFYVDTRRFPLPAAAELDRLSDDERANLVNAAQQADPRALVSLHMAYYTGLVDTVAHVPERCMVGGGYDPTNRAVVDLPVGDGASRRATYIDFASRDRPGMMTHVAYFFQVNGSYEHDSIGGVRKRLQNIFERYGYYGKIELKAFQMPDRTDQAQATMADFLSHAMPEIERCLPDWDAVTGKNR